MRTNLSRLMVAMIGAGLTACGGGTAASPSGQKDAGDDGAAMSMSDGGQPDAGGDATAETGPGDHGAPSSTYPAFTPDFARIQDQGGYVMKSPVVVAITWAADPSQSAFETFADAIGATAYWKTTTSEYGVGPATSGATNHVHVETAPPKQLQDSDLQTMVTTNAGNGWPAPTVDTIYAFFLPPGTSLLVQGFGGGGGQDACTSGVGGYHQGVTAGGVQTAYAVVPSCSHNATPAAQETTMSMSHELVEAVTDPNPNSAAYVGFDGDHFAFDYFQMLQAETGDACEFFRSSFYEDKETSPAFDEWVQRTWSNASGAAAHDPCVPAPAGAYFNVTPLALETMALHIPAQAAMFLPGNPPTSTKGIAAAVGTPVTFPVGFYSDGPTKPWTLSVAAGNPVLGTQSIIDQFNPSSLKVSVDKTSGQNGEKAYVTVTVASHGTLFQGEIVTVTSTLDGVSHYMPIWIGAE
jgi:hypothetical protein